MGSVIGKGLTKFEAEALQVHNELRAKHGCPPLKIDKKLSKLARNWAVKIAAEDVMQHRPDNDCGENIYCKMSTAPKVTATAKEAIEAWYSEIKDYNYEENKFKPGTGHFTQVVWKNTTHFGIAHTKSRSNTVFIVANYSPAGNYENQFIENVPPLMIC